MSGGTRVRVTRRTVLRNKRATLGDAGDLVNGHDMAEVVAPLSNGSDKVVEKVPPTCDFGQYRLIGKANPCQGSIGLGKSGYVYRQRRLKIATGERGIRGP